MLPWFAAFAVAADPPVEPRLPGRSAELVEGDVRLSPAAFVAMIFDCGHYPAEVATLGVKAVESCRVLERSPESVVIYERTGGSLVFTRRQSVLWIRVVPSAYPVTRVEWDLVKQTPTETGWEGAWAEVLLPDAIRTPTSHGGWELDSEAHTVRYWITVDIGGAVPGIFVSEGSLLGLTRAMLARER